MSLGMRYTTEMPISQLAALIEQQAKDRGYEVCVEHRNEDEAVLTLIQTTSWYWVLLRALPQRVYFTLRRSDKTTQIAYTTRYFLWYAAVVVALCVATALLFLFGVPPSKTETSVRGFRCAVLKVLSLSISLVLFFYNFHLIRAGHSRRMESLWEAIRGKAEEADCFLDPVSTEISKGFACKSIAYIAFIVSLAVLGLAGSFPGPASWVNGPPFVSLLLILSLLSLPLLFLGLGLVLLKEGFSLRMLPLIPGTDSLLAVFFFLAGQFPIVSVTSEQHIAEVYAAYQKASYAVQANKVVGTDTFEEVAIDPETMGTACAALRYLKLYAAMHLIGPISLLTISAFLTVAAFQSARRSLSGVLRMHSYRERRVIRAAISGSGFLSCYRVIFVGLWMFFFLAILAGMALCLISLRDVFCTNWTHPVPKERIGPVGASAITLTIVFDQIRMAPAIVFTAHVCWLVYSLVPLTLLGLSLIDLLHRRSRKLRELQAGLVASATASEQVHAILENLSGKARIACPNISITQCFVPFSQVYTFGVVRSKTFVEVSSRCLAMFREEELEALLAHELGHCARGHLLVRNLLRLLGRMTFVGDSFASAFENTFGYESEADSTAVEIFGIREATLIRVLQRVRHARAAASDIVSTIPSGSAPLASFAGDPKAVALHSRRLLRLRKRLTIGARLYLHQYTHSATISYWHPATEDRIRALSERASQYRYNTGNDNTDRGSDRR